MLPRPHQHLVFIAAVFYFGHSGKCVAIFRFCFNLRLPNGRDVEHLFRCLSAICAPHLPVKRLCLSSIF